MYDEDKKTRAESDAVALQRIRFLIKDRRLIVHRDNTGRPGRRPGTSSLRGADRVVAIGDRHPVVTVRDALATRMTAQPRNSNGADQPGSTGNRGSPMVAKPTQMMMATVNRTSSTNSANSSPSAARNQLIRIPRRLLAPPSFPGIPGCLGGRMTL